MTSATLTLPADAAPRSATSRSLFLLAICAGSFLLFLVQPMIARMALPRLGGAPTVWNSAMLVYQALLLGGYGYAHWLGRFTARRQGHIHVALAASGLLLLPIGLMSADMPVDANPFLWVPWLLLGSIGPLFFIVSAQAPLIQRWFALSGDGDPYPLYSASNLGSFGGLIAYPLVVEPLLSVPQQSLMWSVGYALLMLATAAIGLRLPASGAAEAIKSSVPLPSRRQFARWVMLAAIPSALMLSTSLHITTDVMAMPLLWALPLGLYLLSFSVAFADRRGPAEIAVHIAPAALLFACYGLFAAEHTAPLLFAGVALIALFVAATAIHAQMFKERPDPAHLTRFYFAMSLGGAVGGLVGGLLAPLIFNWTYVHPLLLLASAAIIPQHRVLHLLDGRTTSALSRIGAALILIGLIVSLGASGMLPGADPGAFRAGGTILLITFALVALGHRRLFLAMLALLMLTSGGWEKLSQSVNGRLTRSFFGIYAVKDMPGGWRQLAHGTTVHGIQDRRPGHERDANSYYVPQSGIGLAMTAAPRLFGPKARISVVGLGIGTLACYRQPGQDWRFYEIDPAILAFASDKSRFTFMSDCAGNVPTLIGDARLVLARQPKGQRDMLTVDAFSSDSVPMHLMTREAFGVYGQYLTPDGLLMVHVSNRYLKLEPVVASATRQGWSAMVRRYMSPPSNKLATGSDWIALSRNPATLAKLKAASPAGAWVPLVANADTVEWTDDHASILGIIRWGTGA